MKLNTQNSELITHNLELAPFLLEAQNADGGWGYRPDAASATEPTAWALQALSTVAPSGTCADEGRFWIADSRNSKLETRNSQSAMVPSGGGEFRFSNFEIQAVRAGVRWLHDAQLPDGSWPVFVGQRQGCWVTAAACLALNAWSSADLFSEVGGSSTESPGQGAHTLQSADLSLVTRHSSVRRVARGLVWLCRTWPAEGNFWWRFRQVFRRQASVIRQNSSLRGWSWTPGAASWVEPTSCALIALRAVPKELRPRGASKRRQLGESMLYDRMCPGGGWNSGNALVYGVAGEPRVGPTAWALLALEDYRDRPENVKSLDWLDQVYPHIRGPASLALAHLCLEVYDRPLPPLQPALSALWANNQFFRNVLATSWALIALSEAGVRSQ